MFRLLFAACLAIAAAPATAGEALAPRALAAAQASADAPQVVDARSPEEYAAGHVPGAVSIPHDADLSGLALDRGRDVVVYCRSGRRAQVLAEALLARGFRVDHLDGDFPAWEAADLPVVRGPAPGAPSEGEPAR
ncbi:rhodanese-like domain-containing protein [Coralloluteibacterium stylophorae]|uniref:Rhodanese-like domain-containing protein n=1 Tax=Coralloluteibacterium stylophorae TaxID=1776034 RepID=A0A8J8AXM8_9GAMM|nr:rhodanese-like domain-containing protein [Coralloluteibacterium stylophorae]MBS7458204.1 rhodanese-like domain-containing protein [Coralloluteibacterium stylophorae]